MFEIAAFCGTVRSAVPPAHYSTHYAANIAAVEATFIAAHVAAIDPTDLAALCTTIHPTECTARKPPFASTEWSAFGAAKPTACRSTD